MGIDSVLLTKSKDRDDDAAFELERRILTIRAAKKKILLLSEFPLGMSSTDIAKRVENRKLYTL